MKVLLILFYYSTILFSQNTFRDDFENLDQWKPLAFKKIEKHTQYLVEKGNPHGSY